MNTIEKAGYVASESQIEELAHDVAVGKSADSTYLRVLVVAVQTALKAKRQRAATAVGVAHDRFYAAVLRGVGADDITPKERRRRATFARTAASTLRSFVRAGGDIRSLEVATVTKGSLRAFGITEVPEGTRYGRIATRAQEQLVRALKRMKPAEARRTLAAVLDALGTMREELPQLARAARVVKGSAQSPRIN